MHTQICILLHTIVEAVWSPGICEEDERDRLPKVVELQATCTDSIHDGGIVDDPSGYVEVTGSEDDVCMRRCTV